MDFIDQLRVLSAMISNAKDIIKTEIVFTYNDHTQII
jgi:hypothetical protein